MPNGDSKLLSLIPKINVFYIDLILVDWVWHIPYASVFPPEKDINGTQLSVRTLTRLAGNFRLSQNEIRLHR